MGEVFSVTGAVGPDSVEVRLSQGLRTWPIRDASGAVIAAAHGFLIENWLGAGLSVTDGEIRTAEVVDTPAEFEKKVIFGLCGLLLFETYGGALGRRLYPDCGGTIPLVYCPDNRRFAASPNHLFSAAEYDARLLHDRVHKLVRNEGHGGWIPGTLTAHRGVERLIANHYLDLDLFTAHRFWPHQDMLASPPTLGEAVETIAAALSGFTEALAGRYRISASLSAGLDSRIVLCALHNVRDRVSAYTLGDGSNSYDQMIPPEMCRDLGIRHRRLPIVQATAAEMELWDRESGYVVDSVNRGIFPTLANVDADFAFTGLFGEASRCYLYQHDWRTVDQAPADVLNILARLSQPRDSEMEDNIAAWLAPVEHLPRSTILDLAYLELRMSSWAMAQAPVQRSSLWMMMPFAQWPVQQAFLALPVEVRGSQSVLRHVGKHLWPDAMEWPINAYGNWRDRLGPLNKLLHVDGWKTVQRYIRKRMAQVSG